MAFVIERTGIASLVVYDESRAICEIRDLRLQGVRLQRDGATIIGEEVPLPLYWEQYANHEDPERNSGSHAWVRVMESGEDRVLLECTGATHSRSVLSQYLVTLTRTETLQAYVFDIHAALRVGAVRTWQVTPNPNHGELEFCNFWPDGVFVPDARKPSRYDACYVIRGGAVDAVAHHHLESSDKHNIRLQPGDRMAWLLEDENPCIELVAGGEVTAGVCAYMWDAHLAYRICHAGTPQALSGGTQYNASFRLFAIGRKEGEMIAESASRPSLPEVSNTPIIVDGVHTFSETLTNTKLNPIDVWPWETDVAAGDSGDVLFARDHGVGMDDGFSLRIDASGHSKARWKATALGPAFRQPAYEKGARYRLVGFVRSRLTSGHVSVALRLHRTGSAGLFEPESYDIYRSPDVVRVVSEWTRLEVLTPPIDPAPDRVHLLLELDGAGTCWFDNVLFSRER